MCAFLPIEVQVPFLIEEQPERLPYDGFRPFCDGKGPFLYTDHFDKVRIPDGSICTDGALKVNPGEFSLEGHEINSLKEDGQVVVKLQGQPCVRLYSMPDATKDVELANLYNCLSSAVAIEFNKLEGMINGSVPSIPLEERSKNIFNVLALSTDVHIDDSLSGQPYILSVEEWPEKWNNCGSIRYSIGRKVADGIEKFEIIVTSDKVLIFDNNQEIINNLNEKIRLLSIFEVGDPNKAIAVIRKDTTCPGEEEWDFSGFFYEPYFERIEWDNEFKELVTRYLGKEKHFFSFNEIRDACSRAEFFLEGKSLRENLGILWTKTAHLREQPGQVETRAGVLTPKLGPCEQMQQNVLTYAQFLKNGERRGFSRNDQLRILSLESNLFFEIPKGVIGNKKRVVIQIAFDRERGEMELYELAGILQKKWKIIEERGYYRDYLLSKIMEKLQKPCENMENFLSLTPVYEEPGSGERQVRCMVPIVSDRGLMVPGFEKVGDGVVLNVSHGLDTFVGEETEITELTSIMAEVFFGEKVLDLNQDFPVIEDEMLPSAKRKLEKGSEKLSDKYDLILHGARNRMMRDELSRTLEIAGFSKEKLRATLEAWRVSGNGHADIADNDIGALIHLTNVKFHNGKILFRLSSHVQDDSSGSHLGHDITVVLEDEELKAQVPTRWKVTGPRDGYKLIDRKLLYEKCVGMLLDQISVEGVGAHIDRGELNKLIESCTKVYDDDLLVDDHEEDNEED